MNVMNAVTEPTTPSLRTHDGPRAVFWSNNAGYHLYYDITVGHQLTDIAQCQTPPQREHLEIRYAGLPPNVTLANFLSGDSFTFAHGSTPLAQIVRYLGGHLKIYTLEEIPRDWPHLSALCGVLAELKRLVPVFAITGLPPTPINAALLDDGTLELIHKAPVTKILAGKMDCTVPPTAELLNCPLIRIDLTTAESKILDHLPLHIRATIILGENRTYLLPPTEYLGGIEAMQGSSAMFGQLRGLRHHIYRGIANIQTPRIRVLDHFQSSYCNNYFQDAAESYVSDALTVIGRAAPNNSFHNLTAVDYIEIENDAHLPDLRTANQIHLDNTKEAYLPALYRADYIFAPELEILSAPSLQMLRKLHAPLLKEAHIPRRLLPEEQRDLSHISDPPNQCAITEIPPGPPESEAG